MVQKQTIATNLDSLAKALCEIWADMENDDISDKEANVLIKLGRKYNRVTMKRIDNDKRNKLLSGTMEANNSDQQTILDEFNMLRSGIKAHGLEH